MPTQPHKAPWKGGLHYIYMHEKKLGGNLSFNMPSFKSERAVTKVFHWA